MKKGLLIAVGAAVVLLVFMFVAGEQPQVNPASGSGERSLDLSGFDPAHVSGLELSGARRATLRRDNGGWSVADPGVPESHFAADEAMVKGALEALARVSGAKYVTREVDRLPEYWLDDGGRALKVRILQEGRPPLELVLGREGASNGGTYVRRAADTEVFEHPVRLGWLWRKRVMDWRDSRLVRVAPGDISALAFRVGGAAPLTVSFTAAGGWRLAEGTQVPEGFRFSALVAEQVAGDLLEAEVQDVLTGDAAAEAARALAQAHDTVEARLKSGKAVVLRLGRESESSDTVAVQVEGDSRVYAVSAVAASNVRKQLEDFRDLRLLRFAVEKVNRLTIQTGDTQVVVVKEGQGWTLLEPQALPESFTFDAIQVEAQLVLLQQLKAARLLDAAVQDAEVGLSPPAASVELVEEGGAAQTLWLGNEVPNAAGGVKEVYARGSLDAFTYAVEDRARAWLAKGPALFSGP